jgi:hypothetical protein
MHAIGPIRPQAPDSSYGYYYYYKGYYVYGGDGGGDPPGGGASKFIININDPKVYYEWNARETRWMKFNEDDPEPPTDLRPGTHDGEIVTPDAAP